MGQDAEGNNEVPEDYDEEDYGDTNDDDVKKNATNHVPPFWFVVNNFFLRFIKIVSIHLLLERLNT